MKNRIHFKEIIAIIVLFSQIVISCTSTPDPAKVKGTKISSLSKVIAKPPSSYNDTLEVSSKSAVFFKADSLQLKKMEVIHKKGNFESMVHDCFYQMRYSRIVLKKYWPKVEVIEASKTRYLLFITKEQRRIYIDLNKQNDMCGLFIFDGQKAPELVDMTNVETALGFYYR
jgi:hypothetical protein